MEEKRKTYLVTIRREGNEWVARDASGLRRAWGEARDGVILSGRGLVGYLFHANEIGGVMTLADGTVQAEIFE